MLATKSVVIDDLEFEVGMLNVKDARAVLVRLTRVLGPTLTKLAGQDLGSVDVAVTLGHLMTALSEDDLDFVCDKFGTVCKVRVGPNLVSVKGAGEAVFQGKLMTMFRWLWECIQWNFADFLGALQATAPPKSTGGGGSPSKFL